MKFRWPRTAARAVLLVLVLCGCATAPRSPSLADRAAVYPRAERSFAAALLLKPQTTLPEDLAPVRLAPLLLLEVGEATGSRGLGAALPIVWFREGWALLDGRVHVQVDYRWRVDLGAGGALGDEPRQGIRLTLNTAGEPVLWEVLRDSSRVRVFFAARSLEVEALREFGPALPGRRYALERAVSESPEVVVARVIEDGPVAMGPIVHVSAATGDITSVICRCMAPKVEVLVGQRDYELVPADSSFIEGEREPAVVSQDPGLRLPAGF